MKRSQCLFQLSKDTTRSGVFERGMYIPIKTRAVDTRVDDRDAQITSRIRRELRTEIQTGETRQTVAPAWSAKQRPTHFLSLRLPSNNVFQKSVAQFHESEVRLTGLASGSDPRVQAAPHLGGNDTAHLHKCIPCCGGRFEQQATTVAYDKLDAVNDAVKSVLRNSKGFTLRFQGLGTFQDGRVLFSRVATDHHAYALSQLVGNLRKELGLGLQVDMKGNPYDSYVPHVTLAKIRPSQQKTFGRAIPPSVWATHQHASFGTVNFGQVDLCEMATDEATGYYRVVNSFTL